MFTKNFFSDCGLSRHCATLSLSLALAACGGGGSETPRLYAGVNANFWPSPCTVPSAVKFVPVSNGGGSWRIQRQQFDTQSGGWSVLTVNPENNPEHAPTFIQNCTPGDDQIHPEDTQWLTFKLSASNYFGSSSGDHLAVMLRARFEDYDTALPKINGRGIIFHTRPNGVFYERYANRSTDGFVDYLPASNVVLANDSEYAVSVSATAKTVQYSVTDTRTGQTITGSSPLSTPSGTDGATQFGGLALAMLCGNAVGGTCDAMTSPASVQFYDIQTGWR